MFYVGVGWQPLHLNRAGPPDFLVAAGILLEVTKLRAPSSRIQMLLMVGL